MCGVCELAVDQARADDFGEKMVGMLNQGALALMTSIGHRAGLFDTMAGMPPADSETIARRSSMNERYVREWLGAMVTGGIVDYDQEHATYRLPAEHAACLTRAAAPNNLAAFAQYVPQLGSVEDEILGCFEKGGGVPYSSFPRFQSIMAEDSGQTVLPALIDDILPLVPGLIGRLEEGIDVLDVGCGSGRALNMMASTFPNSRFYGYDFSTEGIAAGRALATAFGVTNLQFEVMDVAWMEDYSCFDLITTFDAVHDQAKPDAVLAAINRALRPDGVYLMQDIAGSSEVGNNRDHPLGPLLYTISCLHCMTVSLADGGMGLGAMWGQERAETMLADAGFRGVEVHRLDHDIQNAYYICRKN